MSKRVFRFDKWAEDPAVQGCIRHSDSNYISKMKSIDGREVENIKGVSGFIDNLIIHVDWTDEPETDPILENLLLFGTIALAIYGLACFCENLKELVLGLL